MIESLFSFVDGRNVPGLDPPQGQVQSVEFLEPLPTISHDLSMSRLVYICLEFIDRFPNRHIDRDAIVVIRAKSGRVTFIGLQSPNKTGALIRESIDLFQLRNETKHDRIISTTFGQKIYLCDTL